MNLEIKSKITIIICAVTIIFASISIYTANRMQETAQNIYDHPIHPATVPGDEVTLVGYETFCEYIPDL